MNSSQFDEVDEIDLLLISIATSNTQIFVFHFHANCNLNTFPMTYKFSFFASCYLHKIGTCCEMHACDCPATFCLQKLYAYISN